MRPVEAVLVRGKRFLRLECRHLIPEPPEWARVKRYTCPKCSQGRRASSM